MSAEPRGGRRQGTWTSSPTLGPDRERLPRRAALRRMAHAADREDSRKRTGRARLRSQRPPRPLHDRPSDMARTAIREGRGRPRSREEQPPTRERTEVNCRTENKHLQSNDIVTLACQRARLPGVSACRRVAPAPPSACPTHPGVDPSACRPVSVSTCPRAGGVGIPTCPRAEISSWTTPPCPPPQKKANLLPFIFFYLHLFAFIGLSAKP
jgi:hypothetical protein